MKVFISWSGRRAERVAEALRDWLPFVIPSIEPWLSSTDIEAGARWNTEIARQLEETKFGIICLTRDSMEAPWVLFEAGALAKSITGAFVCPLLLDLNPTDIRGPLAQFQAITTDKESVWKLVISIYRAMPSRYFEEGRLRVVFDRFWPDLQQVFSSVPPIATTTPPIRPDRELLEDILDGVRDLSRTLTMNPPGLGSRQHSPARASDSFVVIDTTKALESGSRHVVYLAGLQTVQNFLDEVYLEVMSGVVASYTYGSTWWLRDKESGTKLQKDSSRDRRPLRELGLRNGHVFEVVLAD